MTPAARNRTPRPPATRRGPSGLIVFVVFLCLAVVCVSGGFALGRYLLDTLADSVVDTGGGGSGGNGTGGGSDDGNGSGGGDGSSGTGDGTGGDGSGSGGGDGGSGSIPAGGGAGSVICDLAPLTLWTIQVGAFGQRANADAAVTKLTSGGFAGYVLSPNADSSLYKVRTATGLDREVIDAALARVKTGGFPDAFVTTQMLGSRTWTITGSSIDYADRLATGIETLLSAIRIQGDLWDDNHAGRLDREAAGRTVEALITTIREAKNAVAEMQAPSDLSALGERVQQHLLEATTNLQSLKSFLSGQAEADRLAAESSFIGLVDSFARLEAGIGQ